MAMTEIQNFAVLIDADNVASSNIKGILEEITKSGNPTIKRIYGDFTSSQLNSWKAVLLEKLASAVHLEKSLDLEKDVCYTNKEDVVNDVKRPIFICNNWHRHERWPHSDSNRLYCTALQIIRKMNRRFLYARC